MADCQLTGGLLCLMLNEESTLEPVFNRALKILGASGVCLLLNQIERDRPEEDYFQADYFKEDGTLRTRGGMFIRLNHSIFPPTT